MPNFKFKNCVANVSAVKLFPGCNYANLFICYSAIFALPGDYTVNGWLSLRRRAGGRDDFILTTKPQEVSFSLFFHAFFSPQEKKQKTLRNFWEIKALPRTCLAVCGGGQFWSIENSCLACFLTGPPGATQPSRCLPPSFQGGAWPIKLQLENCPGRGRVADTLKLAAAKKETEGEETLSPCPLGFFPQRNRRGVCARIPRKKKISCFYFLSLRDCN